MPGKLIEINEDTEIMIYCEGTRMHIDDPIIFFISGAGDIWAIWEAVYKPLVGTMRICAYDRPGLGWSDRYKADDVLDINKHIEIAYEILQKGEAQGPYIVVGHSIGGLLTRRFASAYMNDTLGIVLVDASVEGQFKDSPEIVKANADGQTFLSVLSVGGVFGAVRIFGFGIARAESHQVLSKEAQGYIAAAFRQTSGIGGIIKDSESCGYDLLVDGVMDTDLGDMPVGVLCQNKPSEAEMETHDLHVATQRTLLDISDSVDNFFVLANQSGHYIHTIQPELVVDAIRRVVNITLS